MIGAGMIGVTTVGVGMTGVPITGVGMVLVGIVAATACGNALPSAARNAPADWNRAAGSFSIAIRIRSFSAAGTPGITSMGAAGLCCMCADMIEKSLSPTNGRRPVTISYIVMPTE